jgi:DNA replication initiation complex subunit (GINS family)
MRDWIDEQYEVLTNRLAGRPEPFLKDIEKIPETKRSQDGEDAKPDDDKKADETDDETQNKETGASSGNGKTSSSSKSFENAFKKRLSAAFSG